AAQGIRLDSTFAANKGRGYLFGTARPYRILDENGLPLPLRELPFVNQEDWGGADQAFFTRLLERNAERHRGAIVSLFHPHLVVQTEAGAALFEHSARTALATGHQPMNFRDLLAFWDARDRAVIRSAAAGADLSVEIAVERADFVLGFPVAADGEIPVEAFLDGQSAPLGQARVGGLDYALVSLPAGEHRLTLRWGAR
ncbi:MAG: hypothetical protein HY812_10910, partial [Planctomycetes bacterium]|nr:hypothetical protein [Planctomycetota bacterium]